MLVKRKSVVSLISIVVVMVVVLGGFVVVTHPGHFRSLKRIAGIYVKSTPSKDWHFAHHGKGTPGTSGTPAKGISTGTAGTSNPTGMPYVQGDQVFDGAGHPLLLRGAQIESAFAYYLGPWPGGP